MGDLFSSKSKQTSNSSSTNSTNSAFSNNSSTNSTSGALSSSLNNTSNTSASNSLNTSSNNTVDTSNGASSQTTNTGPSAFQLPYLTDAFSAAAGNYAASAGTPFYSGELYAGMSDQAKSDLQSIRDYASGTGLGTANTLSNLGTSLTANFGKADQAISDYLAAVNGNSTDDIISAAQKYAANPAIDAEIDAANRDVSRDLDEVTLPGIDRQASATGNINSSRAGVAAGIAQRGASDRMADTAASIRSAAYSQGLTVAQEQQEQKLQGLQAAIGAYTGLAGQGISALGAGSTAGYQALSALGSADQTEQANRQGADDAAYASWQGNDSRSSDLLSRFYSIIGNNSWGTSGTTTGSSTGTNTGTSTGVNAGSLFGTNTGTQTGTNLDYQVGNETGTSNGTSTGTASGTSKGTVVTSSDPGLGGILSMAAGGLSLAGGLGWKPFAAKAGK